MGADGGSCVNLWKPEWRASHFRTQVSSVDGKTLVLLSLEESNGLDLPARRGCVRDRLRDVSEDVERFHQTRTVHRVCDFGGLEPVASEPGHTDHSLGTAYAVWTGMGVIGTVVIGIVYFGDPAGAARIILLMILVGSIIGLKLVSPV